ncbi:MAG: 3-oxoacyl-ACP reductase FabG [Paludibacteraceae bacterium]|nr:3-oxoacyl-ACP reductase FabG [Paludibacteraceae bacterium]
MNTNRTKDKRYALVTGGSRGIGRAVCLQLARDGYHVIINYRSNQCAAQETKLEIEKIGGEAELLPFDVADMASVDKALSRWEQDNKGEFIEVLVNNAGIARNNLLLDMTLDEWHDVINANLNSFFYVTRRVLLEMVLHHKGSIINMSSILAHIGMRSCVNYSAAKAALIGATKSLAVEVAPKKITVNAIAPGGFDTEIINDEFKQMVLPHIPMKRLGRPEEIADLVSFLASEKARYISGQVIGIDGGGFV